MGKIHHRFSHTCQVSPRFRRLTTLLQSHDHSHTLKENLVMAQNHMKQQADQGCSECQFVEGDQVFLRLQPYKKTSLKVEHCQKLTPKFYGPYTILK
jgi:hypothetical protein